jgi:uncharacterized protein involved in type VI secretion and phage assembly
MRDRSLVRKIDGLVTALTVGVAKNRAPEVKVVLEPRYALTKLRSDIRVFRKKTVPEVVVEVLNGLGVKTELRLSAELRAARVQRAVPRDGLRLRRAPARGRGHLLFLPRR